MGQIGGVKSVRVDNLSPKVGDTVDVIPHTVSRESVVGLQGDAGFRQTNRSASIAFEVLETGDVKVKDLLDKVDATVTVVTSVKTYVLRNARQVGDLQIALADGKYTVTFEGPELRVF